MGYIKKYWEAQKEKEILKLQNDSNRLQILNRIIKKFKTPEIAVIFNRAINESIAFYKSELKRFNELTYEDLYPNDEGSRL